MLWKPFCLLSLCLLCCRVDGDLVVNFCTSEWNLHPVHPVTGSYEPGVSSYIIFEVLPFTRIIFTLRTSRSVTRVRPIRVHRVHRTTSVVITDGELQDLLPGSYPDGSTGYTNQRYTYNCQRTSRSSTRVLPIRVDRVHEPTVQI